MNALITDRIRLVCICPTCCSTLQNPVTLECSHSFCLKCANSYLLLRKLTKSDYFCPECHLASLIVPTSKGWLVKNLDVPVYLAGSSEIKCVACSGIGNWCCRSCMIFLCEHCAHNHIQRKYKFHKVVTFEEYKQEFCYLHGLKKDLFCMEDCLLLCKACSLNHASHEIEALSSALNILTSQILLHSEFLNSIILCDSQYNDIQQIKDLSKQLISQNNPLKLLQYSYKLNHLLDQPQKPAFDSTKIFYADRGSAQIVIKDLAGGILETLAEKPFPKWCGVTVLPNNFILITGGKSAKDEGAIIDLYILNNELRVVYASNMINAHGSHGVILVCQKVYIMAGKNESNIVGNHCETFDILTHECQQISYMKRNRTCPAVSSLKKEIYIIGGFTQGISNNMEKYSISNDLWTDLPVTLPVKLFQPGAVAIENDQILILGGEITTEIKSRQSFVFNPARSSFGLCRKMEIQEGWLGSWYHIHLTQNKVWSLKKTSLIRFDLEHASWEFFDGK